MSIEKQKKQSLGSVRINAGMWRGQKLTVLDQAGLRPTGDRIKQTLFNWLQGDIVHSSCLDLFAGSGVLGFEALSRGAKQCVFVESNPKVSAQIQSNISHFERHGLKKEEITLFHGQAETFLTQAKNSVSAIEMVFNLVFIDPPFELKLHSLICQQLEKSELLAQNAIIYIESPKNELITIPANWLQLKSKTVGDVTFSLYQRTFLIC